VKRYAIAHDSSGLIGVGSGWRWRLYSICGIVTRVLYNLILFQQLEQKILKLQEEVTELHRRRGENASQVLGLSAKLTERETELDLNRTAAAIAVAKNADLEEQVKFLQSCLHE